MSNSGFTLLWSKILDSSVWMLDGPTRLTWITILAMKDKNGVVMASVAGLAHRARVTTEECRKALDIFMALDPDDSSKVEQGIKIREVSGGWAVVNHELYRYADEAKREFWRQQKAEQRKRAEERKRLRQKAKLPSKSPPLPGENAYLKGVELGTIDKDGVPVRPEHPEDE